MYNCVCMFSGKCWSLTGFQEGVQEIFIEVTQLPRTSSNMHMKCSVSHYHSGTLTDSHQQKEVLINCYITIRPIPKTHDSMGGEIWHLRPGMSFETCTSNWAALNIDIMPSSCTILLHWKQCSVFHTASMIQYFKYSLHKWFKLITL